MISVVGGKRLLEADIAGQEVETVELPPEILAVIFKYTDLQSHLSAMCVNTQWNLFHTVELLSGKLHVEWQRFIHQFQLKNLDYVSSMYLPKCESFLDLQSKEFFINECVLNVMIKDEHVLPGKWSNLASIYDRHDFLPYNLREGDNNYLELKSNIQQFLKWGLFRKAAELVDHFAMDHEQLEAYRQIYEMSLKFKQNGEALEVLEKINGLRKKYVGIVKKYQNLGNQMRDSGQYGCAVKCYEIALINLKGDLGEFIFQKQRVPLIQGLNNSIKALK